MAKKKAMYLRKINMAQPRLLVVLKGYQDLVDLSMQHRIVCYRFSAEWQSSLIQTVPSDAGSAENGASTAGSTGTPPLNSSLYFRMTSLMSEPQALGANLLPLKTLLEPPVTSRAYQLHAALNPEL